MKAKILGILSALILVLCFSLPTLAGDSGTITITMTGADEISITLDKTNWDLGNVASNAVRETIPPIEWCTLTVAGNCNVKTSIVGEDAKWVSNPTAYKWTLSNDGSSGQHIYGLWFRISGDTTRGPNVDGYVPVTKTQSEFWPYGSTGSSLAPGDKRQFGLRLVTPTYFYSGREMQAQVTISAVAA